MLALPFSILRSSVDLSRAGFEPLKQTAIRELEHAEQFLDVHFDELMADPAGQVQRIHRWAGLGGEEAAAALDAFDAFTRAVVAEIS